MSVFQVVLRMLCNYGYDVHRCFDCPYGNRAHVPEGYEGWSDSVIKDTLVRAQMASATVLGLKGGQVEHSGAPSAAAEENGSAIL